MNQPCHSLELIRMITSGRWLPGLSAVCAPSHSVLTACLGGRDRYYLHFAEEMARLRAEKVDMGCPRSPKDANPGLSDINSQGPLINTQNCPLSSSLPTCTSPLIPPLGQGLGLGPLCFGPSATSGCGHTQTHLCTCVTWLPGELTSKCSLNAGCSYLCTFNFSLGHQSPEAQ